MSTHIWKRWGRGVYLLRRAQGAVQRPPEVTGSFAGATGVTKTLQAGSCKAVWSSGFLLSGRVVCRSVDMEGLAPKEDVKINYPKLTAKTVHMSEVVSSRERIRVPSGSQLACGLGPGTQATPHLLHLQTEPGCLPLTET